MLEYIKLILWKVSFDRALFEKELKKGIAQLDTDEVLLLQDWCFELFYDRYFTVLNSTFCGEASQGYSHQALRAGQVYTSSFPSNLSC